MLGHGLKEKTAIEAATKVQGDWYCQFFNLLVITDYRNVSSKLDEKTIIRMHLPIITHILLSLLSIHNITIVLKLVIFYTYIHLCINEGYNLKARHEASYEI